MEMCHSFLQILLSIISVRCCTSFSNSGCLSPGATLGGTLVFTGQSGQDVAEPPAWISGRKLVFVTGSFPLKRTLGLGRGRIWMSKRGCRGGFCQSTYHSSNGNLPCFEDLVAKANIPSYSRQRTQVLQFTGVTPTSIRVTWPAWNQDIDVGSGPISKYQIEIRKEGESQFRVISAGESLTYLFENLTENTDYEFRLVIFRNHATHGEGPPSDVQTQRTLPRPPFYKTNNVILFTDVTPTSINVSWPAWNQNTDVGSGPISKYQIEIRKEGESQFRVISAGKSLTYLFENLTENTDYEFRLVVFRNHTTHGEGPPSNIQIQRTLPRPPFYKTNNVILFTDVTPTSINVSWPAWNQDTDVGSGPISKYQIEIRKEGESQFRVISAGKSLTYLFENLTENTDYEFRLVVFRNHTTHGEGPPSNIQIQRTLPRPPFYKTNNVILFTDVTPTSINVSWPAWNQDTDVGSGPISKYQIEIRKEGESQFRVISAGKSLTYLFENLTENTDYEFRLVVFRNHTTHGEGPPSNIQTQRTLPYHVPSYSQSNRSDILKFSDVTSTSINVTWPAWDQATDVGSGPIASYKIQIKERFTDAFRTISVGKRFSYNFENLTEDTEYAFRVVIVSVHPNGEGPPSPTQSSKTPCGVHKEDVHLNLTTPTWKRGKVVVARWQIADRQKSCGAVKKHLNVELRDLDRCPTDSSEIPESIDLNNATRNRTILKDRKPNSLYKITLSVAYGGGEFYNISDEIRTLDTEPTSPPQNLRVEVIGSGMLKFEWTKPPCGGCNGVVAKYQTSFLINGRELKDTTGGTSKIYFGLNEGDRYTFKVKAETRYGRGPFTDPGCTSVFGTDIC
ncbi:Titin [Holothuria leucospilota]|uniref:Titin n=1 Tax=Holothuria leucospilota TaxID=206669 RepID=A0A9Q1BLY2_HOLLE|nr:Titin [Holothuria leucospilota]